MTLTNPPAIIKLDADFSAGLDVSRNPYHAKAYLKAASHFLSCWPQDWSAERLCLALIADEDDDIGNSCLKDREKVKLWEPVSKSAHPMECPFQFVEELINGLAEDFITFLKDFITSLAENA